MQRIDRWPSFLSLVVLITALTVPGAPAQAQDTFGMAPRVFLDCRGRDCNGTYFRTEITWVTWVRDQEDAHVHVIWTSQNTGAGGQEYLLDFTGGPAYPDYEAQSRYQSLPTDTQRERLDALTLTLGVIVTM